MIVLRAVLRSFGALDKVCDVNNWLRFLMPPSKFSFNFKQTLMESMIIRTGEDRLLPVAKFKRKL